MTIKEYLILIKKTFPYLFKKYEFKVVYSEEYRPGYGWFKIGLESKTCRILFVREQGGGIMFLGPIDAPFNNEDDDRWVVALTLLAYLLKKKWDWRFLDKLHPKDSAFAWLSYNARELEPFCGQVLEMFRSSEIIAEWKPAYKKYLRENAKWS